MKCHLPLLALVPVALWIGTSARAEERSAPPSTQPFALIELFTSEGCSSCPAGDDLLGEIASEARQKGQRIFPLAFHVDYWNDLGWVDPFSHPAYSRRQRAYAQVFDPSRIYTPQMIVNGTDAFVGSNRARARNTIRAALSHPAHVAVALMPEAWGTDSLAVAYEVSGAPPGAVLHVALVERGLVSAVPRGENAGRTLRHENAVRAFETVRLDGSSRGRIELKPPPSVVRANASLVGYVQDPDRMTVLGAASAGIR